MNAAQILIVRNNDKIVGASQNYFNEFGYDIPSVASIKEAINKVEEIRPDLVFIELDSDDKVNRLEIPEQICENYNIPVVSVVVGNDKDELNIANHKKPFGYLIKPLSKKDVATVFEITFDDSTIEQKFRESYSTILKNISDAVIITDNKGLINIMNPMAEILTGWKLKNAFGKDITEVFIIKEENTNTLTEDDMSKIIQMGFFMNKLSYTMLISKDSTKTPINYSVVPIMDDNGNTNGAIIVFRDITERKKAEELREKLIIELQKTLAKVKTLSGLLPICANCKKVRNDKGYWDQLEEYFAEHSRIEFSHSICPECVKKLYPYLYTPKK